MAPYGVEHVESAERVHIEVGAWVDDGCRDCDLRRQMNHGIEAGLGKDAVDGRAIAYVSVLEFECRAVLEPLEILLRPLPRKVVEDRDLPVSRPEVSGGVAADEAGTPRYQNTLGTHFPLPEAGGRTALQ
jgi:hypothetical protein